MGKNANPPISKHIMRAGSAEIKDIIGLKAQEQSQWLNFTFGIPEILVPLSNCWTDIVVNVIVKNPVIFNTTIALLVD